MRTPVLIRGTSVKARRNLCLVAALALLVAACVSETGVRVALLGLDGLSTKDEQWVLLTQDADCERPLAQAYAYARILGWPRAKATRHLMLSSAGSSVDSGTPDAVLELGQVRSHLVAAALRARGWTRTPLMVRLPSQSWDILVLDLNDTPTRK